MSKKVLHTAAKFWGKKSYGLANSKLKNTLYQEIK